jgi:hypothetical protein
MKYIKNDMKRNLVTFFAVLGLLSTAFVGYIVFALTSGTGLDASSQAWVDDMVPKIAASWDSDLFLANTSSGFRARYSKDDVDKLMGEYSSRFGQLEQYYGSEGEAGIHTNLSLRRILTAEYLAHATFELRSGTISIQAILEDDRWRIHTFYVVEAVQ